MAERSVLFGVVAISAALAQGQIASAQEDPAAEPAAEQPVPESTPAPAASAEEPAAEATSLVPKVSGYVNATYNFNVRNPTGAMEGTNGTNALHVYDAIHNNLQLDAAHVALTG